MATLEEIVVANRRELIRRVEGPLLNELIESYGRVMDSIEQRSRALAEQIAKRKTPPTRSELLRMKRLTALAEQVEDEMRQASNLAADAIRERRRVAILEGIVDARGIGAEIGVRLNVPAVQNIAAALAPGSPLRILIDELPPEASRRVRGSLIDGVLAGRNPRDVARSVRVGLNGDTTRALTIARTETLRSYRAAELEVYRANERVVDGWIWTSALDSTTCFPAGIVVSGPKPHASTSRYYSGPLIVLDIAGREQLSVTPNHPILTDNGWVAAGLLVEGDYVLGCTDGNGASSLINEYNYQMPAAIEQVAESLSVVSVEMPITPPDFHGDGIGSDVYVVRADGLLWDGEQPAFFNHATQGYFSLSHMGSLTFPGHNLASFSRPESRFDWYPPFASPVAVDGAAFLQRSHSTDEFLRFVASPPWCTGDFEACPDGVTIDTVRLSQCLLRFTGDIPSGDLLVRQAHPGVLSHGGFQTSQCVGCSTVTEEPAGFQFQSQPSSIYTKARSNALGTLTGNISRYRILKTLRTSFSGHVYNLETAPHWYVANGVIVANCSVCWAMHGQEFDLRQSFASHPSCRCSPSPRVRIRPPTIRSGVDRFAALPESQQQQILGPAKFRAYRDGALDLPDLVGKARDPRWGETRYEKPLRDVVGKNRAVSFYRNDYAA